MREKYKGFDIVLTANGVLSAWEGYADDGEYLITLSDAFLYESAAIETLKAMIDEHLTQRDGK